MSPPLFVYEIIQSDATAAFEFYFVYSFRQAQSHNYQFLSPFACGQLFLLTSVSCRKAAAVDIKASVCCRTDAQIIVSLPINEVMTRLVFCDA